MNIKFYVSYESARLMKEKGYDGDAEYAYHENGNFSHWGRNVNDIDYLYAAPTKAEAIDWLENKGIVIEVFCARIGENRKWCYSIINTKTYITIETPYKFLTRLEAEEAAIIKACELLNEKEE